MTKLRNTWLPLLALLALLAVASVSCGPGGGPTPPTNGDIEVRIIVNGPGRVIEGPVPFECRDDCLWTGSGDAVTGFSAVPTPGYVFVGWGGVCDVLENPCTRTFEDGDTVTATFALHALRLDLTGDGEGEFRIQGPAIDIGCTDDCAVGLPQTLSLAITYFMHGSAETVLDDWGGACAGADRSDYCLVPVNGATDVSKTWRRPPVAIDDAYATTRNAPLNVSAGEGVLANDSDTPGDTLAVERVTDVTHGTLTLAADGGFGYTPDPGFAGGDGFTYRVRDAFGNLSRTATVTISVDNRPPEAVANSYVTALNTPLTVPAPGVLANDRDPDSDTLIAILVDEPENGTVDLADDGGFVYVPEQDFVNGLATFTYRVSDGLATSDPATVTIGVGLDAPVASDDAYPTFRNQPLTVDAEEGVLDNDVDPEGAPLVAILVDEPENGAVELDADGSFTYDPDEGFVGTDTFTYVADNGEATSVVATVTITVTNRAPVAANDGPYPTFRNQPLTVPAATGLLANDEDPDGDPIIINTYTQPTDGAGSVTVNPNGSFTYTPTTGYTGTTTFTYNITDDLLATSNTATVTITVTNRPPVATNDSYTTDVDTQLVEPAPGVLANDSDPDNDPLTVNAFTQPANGTLVLETDGSFTYDPDPGYVGDDNFTYTATDGLATSSTATVTIAVGP